MLDTMGTMGMEEVFYLFCKVVCNFPTSRLRIPSLPHLRSFSQQLVPLLQARIHFPSVMTQLTHVSFTSLSDTVSAPFDASLYTVDIFCVRGYTMCQRMRTAIRLLTLGYVLPLKRIGFPTWWRGGWLEFRSQYWRRLDRWRAG